jgi:hypothetical protein
MKVRPAAPRPASTPIGQPMAAPVPLTLGEQAAAVASDALDVARRHPKVFATAAAVWILVFGGSAVRHLVTGPSLPTGPSTAAAASSAHVISPDADADLEALAEQERRESAAADAALAERVRQDEAIAAAADAAAARQELIDRRAAARVGARTPAKRSGTRRVVRVMPTNVH